MVWHSISSSAAIFEPLIWTLVVREFLLTFRILCAREFVCYGFSFVSLFIYLSQSLTNFFYCNSPARTLLYLKIWSSFPYTRKKNNFYKQKIDKFFVWIILCSHAHSTPIKKTIENYWKVDHLHRTKCRHQITLILQLFIIVLSAMQNVAHKDALHFNVIIKSSLKQAIKSHKANEWASENV